MPCNIAGASLGAAGSTLAAAESAGEHEFLVALVSDAITDGRLAVTGTRSSGTSSRDAVGSIVWMGCSAEPQYNPFFDGDFEQFASQNYCVVSKGLVPGFTPGELLCPMIFVNGNTGTVDHNPNRKFQCGAGAGGGGRGGEPELPEVAGYICKAPAIKPLLARDNATDDYFPITVEDGFLLTAKSQCASVGLPGIALSASSDAEVADKAGCVEFVGSQSQGGVNSASFYWHDACSCVGGDAHYVCKAPASAYRTPWRQLGNNLYSHVFGMKRSWTQAR